MDHAWISFDLSLHVMSPTFWMQLGEARSKCSHLSNVALPSEYAKQLHQLSLAKGVRATTAIEGNTLTEEEIRSIVAQEHSLHTGDYQVREAENVTDAYNWVLGEIRDGRVPTLTPDLIADFNRRVLDGLPNLEAHVEPGEFRRTSIVVGPYKGPDWREVPELLARMCDWLNGPAFLRDGAGRIPTAIIRASMAHLYIAWIHPFGDGNGRTARLCEYLVLVTSGVPTSAAHLISNHCNDTRDDYYAQLKYASESGGDVSRFLTYCADGLVAGLDEQLAWVYDRQFRLAWKEHVSEQVPGRDQSMRERRERIANELLFKDPVLKRDIQALTPSLAATYATCGPRTLARDLNALVHAGLLLATTAGYQANNDVLLTQLPLVVPPLSDPPTAAD